MHGFIGEIFGTMILTAIGCGIGAGINLKRTFSRGKIGFLYPLAGVLESRLGFTLPER